MNHAPKYRRRRRVAVAVAVTLAGAIAWHLPLDDATDRDPCTLWPDVPPCTINNPNTGDTEK